MKIRSSQGFTLIELAIVLLVVAIILGYTVAMFPIQQELRAYRAADAEMERITDALYAFARVNGYLPCPATIATNGFQCRDGDATLDGGCEAPSGNNAVPCDAWFGFVPGKELGLDGSYSAVNGLMLDPWGQPYRYQVAEGDSDGDGSDDFVQTNGMQAATIANLAPNLVVCNVDPSPGVANADLSNCGGGNPSIVAQNLPAVVLSTGKDTAGDVATTSWIQRENLDNGVVDRVFVQVPFNDAAGTEFDDLVKWLAPNVLYSRMIDAGQLP